MIDEQVTNSRAIVTSHRLHLEFLDGLRGIAALYVVLFHAYYFTRNIDLGFTFKLITAWLNFGHFAVDIFIVLSGFCLMMPLARANTDTLPQGFGAYIYKRARRILPPYYVAFAGSLALALVGQLLQSQGHVGGNQINDVLTPGIVLSHIFMVHNFDFIWAHRINPPMWSVATEWQIYFLFPLLLLPMRRRIGNILTIAVTLGITLLPWLLLPPDNNFYWAYPWFLSLFAMGMLAARSTFNGDHNSTILRWPRCSSWLITLITYAVVGLSILPEKTPIWVADILIGIGTMYLIIYCARAATIDQYASRRPLILRIFESRWAVNLGTFSYSLYLIHSPIQQTIFRLASTRIDSPMILLLIQLFITTPLAIAASYIFFCLFEKPFLNRKQPTQSIRVAIPALQ
jgi:peptidoglycan/LPS O-acetylase OafA/YrhL